MAAPARLRLLLVSVCCVCCFSAAFAASEAGATAYKKPTAPYTEPSFTEKTTTCANTGPGQWGSEPPDAETEHEANLLYWGLVQASDICKRQHLDLEQLAERLFWITEETLHLQEKVEINGAFLETLLSESKVANGHLEALLEGSEVSGEVTLAGVDGEHPLPVADSAAVVSGQQVSESVDASGEALKGALWFLIGAVVALIIGFAIWRLGSLRS